MTPLSSLEGVRAPSSKDIHSTYSSPERRGDSFSHIAGGFQSSEAGDRDYCPKSQNLRVSEMAIRLSLVQFLHP